MIDIHEDDTNYHYKPRYSNFVGPEDMEHMRPRKSPQPFPAATAEDPRAKDNLHFQRVL
jgi:hypothetical protein